MTPPPDEFLLDLFRSELAAHTATLAAGLKDGGDVDALARAAHSIKGAARMVGVEAVVKLVAAMEDALTAVQRGQKKLTPDVAEWLLKANGALAALAEEAAGAIPEAAGKLTLADLTPPPTAGASVTEIRSAEDASRMVSVDAVPKIAAGMEDALTAAQRGQKALTPESAAQPAADTSLLELFRSELAAHTATLAAGLKDGGNVEALARAAHSIKGAARMVGVDPVVKIAAAIEDALTVVQRGQKKLTAELSQSLLDANRSLEVLAGEAASAIPDAAEKLQPMAALPTNAIPATAAKAQAPPEPPPPAADASLLELFRLELETHTRALETGLVAAEGDAAPETIEPLMRASHSIKGAARMVGLDTAVQLAHAMEDLLSGAQRGRWRLGSHHIDRLLEANDCFKALTSLSPDEIPASLAAEAVRFAELGRSLAAPDATAAAPAPSPAPAAPVVAPIDAPKPKQSEEEYVRVLADNLNRLMGLAGECLVQAKGAQPLTTALGRIKQEQYALGEAISRALETRAGANDDSGWLETLNRRAERLHTLTLEYLSAFDQFARRLERLSNRLYDEAVATRMRPFSDALHGYPRMVRDLARGLRKSARLEIEGPGVQVDRDILEKLEAPLTHLLRNAIDHGLETPAERIAAGKPEEGRLTLTARHISGMLSIIVADDGAGIDVAALRRSIIAKGYAPEEMAASLTDAEALEFLFLPGFSTRSEVSEISGRGVGLNIVQAMAHEVGGSARIVTEPGRGTAFHLRLPLTLSVVRSLLLEIGGEPYAIPLARVDRVLRVPRSDVRVVEDRQYCTFEGTHIGIVEATQALDLPAAQAAGDVLNVAVVSDPLNCYGLVVDRFAGERDLVVIPLSRKLGKVANVSAGAILEDGAPVLILDVDDVVRSIDALLTRGGLKKLREAGDRTRSERKRILVVDDSLTVREVERRLLENRGYEVTVAVDGMDGWNALRSQRFDLLITDVDMPRLDGIELTRRARAWQPTSSLPIVIVSYKDQEEYRMKGLEAGANAYLTKSSFHDAGLINTVRDLAGEARQA